MALLEWSAQSLRHVASREPEKEFEEWRWDRLGVGFAMCLFISYQR